MLQRRSTCLRHATYGAPVCGSTVYALPSQPVRQSTVRRKAVLCVTAFRGSPEPVVTFPLNYYKLLAVKRASSPEAVKIACERQLKDPPDVGYSQDTLYSRAVLLRNAAECLQDYQRRKEYDGMATSSKGYAVDVSPEYLPAALVLLQESGDSEIVIELGTQWLQRNSQYPLACDIAAAVALAHCDEAAYALHDDSSVVLTACQNLELSLQLLRQYRMAPQLQQQIMQTLEDYSPRYCLELLALPVDKGHEQQRQRGMTLLRKLAFELHRDISPVAEVESFLRDARNLLTPQELLLLYKSLPRGIQTDTQQNVDVALATVAVGILHMQPHMVQHAAATFKQLQRQAAKVGQEVDLSVERAACALMLGDTQRAQQLLGLAVDKSKGRVPYPDGSIGAFVLEHSPDETDLLPGIYVLGERWLQEAVMGSFRQDSREPQGDVANLGAWFDSRTVQAYIQAHALLRSVNIFRALQIITDAAAAGFLWIVTSLQKLFGQRQLIWASTSSTSESCSKQQPAVSRSLQQLAPLPLVPESPAQHLDEDDLTEQELNVSVLRQRWQQEGHQQQLLGSTGMPHGRQEHMQLLRLEAAMWDSTQLNQNRFRTWWTRLIAMLLVAGAAGVVWAVRPNPQALPVSEVWVLTTGD